MKSLSVLCELYQLCAGSHGGELKLKQVIEEKCNLHPLLCWGFGLKIRIHVPSWLMITRLER